MSRIYIYSSSLAPFMNEFINLKDATGINTRNHKWILYEIDKFYIDENIYDIAITNSIITKWRKTRINDSDRTLYMKFSIWNQLARLMCRQGYECYITPLPREGRTTRNFTPYIFTHEQINAIMRESEELRLYDRHMSNSMVSIPALIRLLYSTGLRISEALNIKNEDVNFEEDCIHIYNTKNRCDRIVPVSPSLKIVLQQFIKYRNKMPLQNIDAPKSYLFVMLNGNTCNINTVYKWFKRLLEICNIPHIGNNRGPRLHDLRHTFAVHSLENMANNGMDLYSCIPILSTCLGHKSLKATEQYVRLTMEMHPHIAEQTNHINMFIFPKLKNTENNED